MVDISSYSYVLLVDKTNNIASRGPAAQMLGRRYHAIFAHDSFNLGCETADNRTKAIFNN